MSYFDDASLVMIPSGYKTSKVYSVKPTDGSGDLTFSRSNDTATRVNSAGLIEKVRTNQVLQSNTFSNASWTKTNATVTGGQAGYDGTTNAWLLSKSGSLGRVTQDVNTSGLKTFSLYAKAGTTNWIAITFTQAESFSYFNVSNGTLGTNFGSDIVARTITSVGSGWYRVSISVNNTSSSVNVYVADSDGTVSGTSGNILIQAAQIEGGDIATDYIATTSAAVSVGPVANVPRLDYLNSSCPRLLLEPQRTSLVTFSESFDNAAWTKVQSSITANNGVSPDGYANADKLIANTTSNIHFANTAIADTAASWTYSIFAKAAGYDRLIMWTAATNFVGFNLTTGVVESTLGIGVTSANIQNYGNGWYRCSITSTSVSSGSSIALGVFNAAYPNGNVNPIFTGNGTSGILIYGAQFEAGAYATSYIPTLGAAVTRGADACSKTGISSLIGQTEGTLFAEFVHNGADILTTQTVISINSGNTQNFVNIGVYDGQLNPAARASSVNIFDLYVGPNPLPAGTHKVALAYKSGDFKIYLNGSAVYTSTAAATFGTMGQLDLGTLLSFGVQLGEGVSQSILFPTRLSNSDLAALTA